MKATLIITNTLVTPSGSSETCHTKNFKRGSGTLKKNTYVCSLFRLIERLVNFPHIYLLKAKKEGLFKLENAKLCTYVSNTVFPSTIHQTFLNSWVSWLTKIGMNCLGDYESLLQKEQVK